MADSFYDEEDIVEVVGDTETVDVMQGSADRTWNIAIIFILSIIVGIMVFNSFSRRWHA